MCPGPIQDLRGSRACVCTRALASGSGLGSNPRILACGGGQDMSPQGHCGTPYTLAPSQGLHCGLWGSRHPQVLACKNKEDISTPPCSVTP